MRLNVVPGWLKILLILAGIALLAWSMLDNKLPDQSGPQVLLVPPQADLDHGLAGKAQSNIRQFATNPLEKPSQAGEGTPVVRDNPENYYRDEN